MSESFESENKLVIADVTDSQIEKVSDHISKKNTYKIGLFLSQAEVTLCFCVSKNL